MQIHLIVSGLQALDLRENMLTYLPSEIFSNMTALVTLHLDDNNLLKLDNTLFHGLKNIKTLILSGNRLVHIRHNTFADLHSLVSLELSHNDLTYLSDTAFGDTRQFTSLTNVYLSHNHLDYTKFQVWPLPAPDYLDLSYNNITFSSIASIDNDTRFIGFPFSYCGISQEPHLLIKSYKPHLAIDMTFNHITGMDLLLLDAYDIQSICVFLVFNSVDLSGNDLVCDCNVFSLYELLGLYSLSGKTSYRQISWSLEAARLDVAMVVSLWNLTGTSAAVLPWYLPNFRAIGKV